MNNLELMRLSKVLCGRRRPTAMRRLESVVSILDGSINREHSAFNLFEVGLHSGLPDRFQVNHIQGYVKCDEFLESSLACRKAQGVLDAVETIHRQGDSGFAINKMERLLKLLKSSRSVFERVLFSFEFDFLNQEYWKVTFYGKIYSEEDARQICRLMNVKTDKNIAALILKDMSNIGVDFYRDGTCKLKIYRRWPFAASLHGDDKSRALLDSLHAEFQFRDYAIMERLNPQGRPSDPIKWGGSFSHTTKVRQLSRVSSLKARFGDFLASLPALCSQ